MHPNDTFVLLGVALIRLANYCSGMTKTHSTPPPGAEADLVHKITNALIVKGVSILTLSEETGIAYPTLRRSLKGQRSLTFNEFGRIAQALNVSPSALLPDALAKAA